jgi:hypothetical protein
LIVSLPNYSKVPQELFIRDIAGKIVLSQKITGVTARVNVANLAEGIYIVSAKGVAGKFLR